MHNPRLIVTGASGLLGSHIVHASQPGDVLGLYHQNQPQDDGYHYHQVDLAEFDSSEALVRHFRPRALIHAAARGDLDWCEKHPDAAWHLNAEVPVALARACAKSGCRYVFISSDMVFDGEGRDYREEDPPRPISLYGRAKLAAEQGMLQANPHAVVVRSALIYGFPVATGRGSSFLGWILARLQHGQPVPLFTDQFRTPVETGEIARAVLQLAQSDFSGIVHIGGSERLDRYTFGRYACEAFGFDAALLEPGMLATAGLQAPRPRDLSLDTSRLASLLGCKLSGCRDGLRRCAQLPWRTLLA